MLRKKDKGYFVTFEGPEGSGKSTQIREAEAYFQNRGYKVIVLREPGGTRIGEDIRRILLNHRYKELVPETELLLYLAARSQIVREKIVPALHQGYVVICDRYEDSTIAYQGYGRKFSLKLIEQMSRLTRNNVLPDRTFLLDIAPEKGLKRGGRRDRMEKQTMVFHHSVRKGFLKMAKKFKRRYVVIDANQTRDEITDIIRKRLKKDVV